MVVHTNVLQGGASLGNEVPFFILLHVCALFWSSFIAGKDGFIAVRLKLNISLPSPLAFTLQSYSAPLTCKARLRCSENSPALRVVILRQALLSVRANGLCRQCKGEAISEGKINDV